MSYMDTADIMGAVLLFNIEQTFNIVLKKYRMELITILKIYIIPIPGKMSSLILRNDFALSDSPRQKFDRTAWQSVWSP